MSKKTLKIATRQSPLALWQANFVKARLQQLYPDLSIELVTMVTKGDVILDSPLAKIGGKGLFVKELENALLNNEADIAVHSMKDVPMQFPEGLGLSVICKREDPRDAFVSNTYRTLAELPPGAIVGTSSLRRQCQLKALRPDLEIRSLRGNVGTRLSKLDNVLLTNGSLLNVKLSPSAVKTEEGINKFVNFIYAYMKLKLTHIQFNVIGVETLKKAQIEPEKYGNLVVRVAGYSAFFSELNKKIQDDIIHRTEHGL